MTYGFIKTACVSPRIKVAGCLFNSVELEKVQIYGNAAFWSFDRKLYAKANWWKKTATPGIGEMITIRTANTLRKIAEM